MRIHEVSDMLNKDDEIFDVDDIKVVEAEEVIDVEPVSAADVQVEEVIDVEPVLSVDADEVVETVDYSDDECFHMFVEDIFNIWGRGVTVVGVCRDGIVTVGQKVSVCAPDGTEVVATVGAIETHKKMLKVAVPGTIVGILLKGITKKQVARGYTLKGIK